MWLAVSKFSAMAVTFMEKFVNWDTCAVLLNCEKDSIQNICYCSTQITSRRAGFSCTFPH